MTHSLSKRILSTFACCLVMSAGHAQTGLTGAGGTVTAQSESHAASRAEGGQTPRAGQYDTARHKGKRTKARRADLAAQTGQNGVPATSNGRGGTRSDASPTDRSDGDTAGGAASGSNNPGAGLTGGPKGSQSGGTTGGSAQGGGVPVKP